MQYIRDNSYTIFKMFVNQIGMTIFGLALSFATGNYETLFLISSIFAAVFYMVLLYTMTWEEGYKHSQAIEAGRMKFVKLGGLWMSLCANVINIILGVMMIVGYYTATEFTYRDAAGEIVTDIAEAVGKSPSAPEFSVNLFGIGKIISTFINGMYNGIMSHFMTYSPFTVVLYVCPSVIVCTIAYYFGVKGKHLTGLVGGTPSRE